MHENDISSDPEFVRAANNAMIWSQYEALKKRAIAKEQAKLRKTPKGPKKIGRNDPCDCGSGKKFKKCCLQAQQK